MITFFYNRIFYDRQSYIWYYLEYISNRFNNDNAKGKGLARDWKGSCAQCWCGNKMYSLYIFSRGNMYKLNTFCHKKIPLPLTFLFFFWHQADSIKIPSQLIGYVCFHFLVLARHRHTDARIQLHRLTRANEYAAHGNIGSHAGGPGAGFQVEQLNIRRKRVAN